CLGKSESTFHDGASSHTRHRGRVLKLVPEIIPNIAATRSSLPDSLAHLFNGVPTRVWLICVLTPLILASSCQRHPQQPAGKWVEVDKTNQVLRAYAGDKLVLESPVSTGKEGHATPNGTFAAGEKSRIHDSDLYDNAPMPYSVQIAASYF